MNTEHVNLKSRWYFGGISSAMAVCVTHPLDLIKVNLQTQHNRDFSFLKMGKEIIKKQGFKGLYAGLDASVLRQLSSTMSRLGVYEIYKNNYANNGRLTPMEGTIISIMSGLVGSVCGNPAEIIKIRMQNDMKLSNELRRNYNNVVKGFLIMIKNEGFSTLFKGISINATKGTLGTLGQGVGYDEFKFHLIKYGGYKDDICTHFLSAFGSGMCMLVLILPLDVIQSRIMTFPAHRNCRLIFCIKDIATTCPSGFYKGLIPSFLRIMPQNILLFLLKEKLTLHFGYRNNET